MGGWMVIATAALVFVSAGMPARAAWKTYVNKELGLSFMAPDNIKTEIGNFRGAIAGPHQTIVYRTIDHNVEYKVTVISFRQAQAEGATILGERQYMFANRNKVLTDTFSRVGSGKNAVYGRKIVVDLRDNKGRAVGAFYFTNGRLISLEATVLPAKANSASPDADRFIDSISFVPISPPEDAIGLDTPKLH